MADQLTIFFILQNNSLKTQNAQKMRQKMKNKLETQSSINFKCMRIHQSIHPIKEISSSKNLSKIREVLHTLT
jgi:hypothetical protein